MITVRIKREFHDKDNFAKVYKVGDVVELQNERAFKLMVLGVVENATSKRKREKQ